MHLKLSDRLVVPAIKVSVSIDDRLWQPSDYWFQLGICHMA